MTFALREPYVRMYTIAPRSFFIFDRPRGTDEEHFILERYFNDMYKMFLSRLTALAMGEHFSPVEHAKMHTLFDEMVKVKGLLEEGDEN